LEEGGGAAGWGLGDEYKEVVKEGLLIVGEAVDISVVVGPGRAGELGGGGGI
jgi:hypothetical protein